MGSSELVLKRAGKAPIAAHSAARTDRARRVMKARRTSICPICGGPISTGQQIALAGRWQHIRHVIERQRGTEAA